MSLRISLIILAYNEEAYIGKCLESVVQQEDPPDEVIVVNNNSTDRTMEIASRFPVRIIHEYKQGIIHARNAGFNAASCDVIARCDADSMVPRDWTARIRGHFCSSAIDALTGPMVFYDLPFHSTIPGELYLWALYLLQGGKHTLCGTNMALRTSLWENVKSMVDSANSAIHEDIDLGRQIHKVGGCIRNDRKFFCYTSGRRIKGNPLSFFGEYPVRLVKTLLR